MQIPNVTYVPRAEPIVYLEVDRCAGYTSKSIHMHDHHEIVLVTSDSICDVTNNGSALTVQTPAIWINRAGSFHEVTHVEEGVYSSKVIFFHPELLSDIPADMRYEKQLFRWDYLGIHLNKEQLQMIIPLIELLKERSVPQKRLFLLSILCQMAQYIEEGCPCVCVALAQSYIFDVIMHIRTVEEKQTIPMLAERFHVSPTKLKNDFKRITGMTVGAYVKQTHLQQARTLLETTRQPVAEIAYACGFSDESYFIEAFRKHYGETPGTFRKKIKAEQVRKYR